ncbi:MAG: linoleoyl-CoA desaturase [Frankiaceae bacterium]|nr:linoleoyl-CoA desaturase [Frankiaceae bacterium]MDQ1650650.1 linoleoyl-CoA desaturase [Frankiaceae bacterium]MDQ1671877.1 linoleoyl-CoA desaturase [Frankiaceae bacterium]
MNHALLIAVALLHPGFVLLMAFAVPLALTLAITTLTVLHDAGHRQFARREWPNILAVQTAAPFGLWAGHWGLKHRVHHRLSQVYPVDEATRSSSFVRLHPEAPVRPMHRYQHLYTWFFYGLAWVGELKSQLTYLRNGRVTGLDEIRPARRRLASFVVEKAMALLVLLPYALALGFGSLGLLLLATLIIGSVMTALVLVVGHINVGLEPLPGAPENGRAWAAHLVRTTASFSLYNPVTRWLTGGMTHHLAHHLRPTALRSELPVLQATTVADVVASSGLPEVVYPSFASAVRHHYLRLWELGHPNSELSVNSDEPLSASSRPVGEPLPVS